MTPLMGGEGSVGTGVAVGPSGVEVAVGADVAVAVGADVAVAVGADVAVGGSGVSVGPPGVTDGPSVAVEVGADVAVGLSGVAVGLSGVSVGLQMGSTSPCAARQFACRLPLTGLPWPWSP